jgi:Na+/alanine symporter
VRPLPRRVDAVVIVRHLIAVQRQPHQKAIFGKKGAKVFVFIYPLFCIIGAIVKVEFAWRTAEFFNGIMLIINLFAVFMLSHKAIKVLGE